MRVRVVVMRIERGRSTQKTKHKKNELFSLMVLWFPTVNDSKILMLGSQE